MNKKSKVLYIISLIFSVFSLFGVICLILTIYGIKTNVFLQFEYGPENGIYEASLWALLIIIFVLGYGVLLMLFWMMIFINSIISLVLVIIYKCKTKKERVLLGYNISVLSLQLITTLILYFQ